jgi:hypothetical protein
MLIYLPFTSYITGSAVALALYYLTIWLLYFAKKPQAAMPASPMPNYSPVFEQSNEKDLSPQVYDFTDELHALLLQSAAQHDDKETITHFLTSLIKKYPSLKGSSFQSPITSLIKQEAADKCNMEFEAAELTALW